MAVSKKKDASISKRQEIKERRRKKQRQQRLYIILAFGAVALVVLGVAIYPSLRPVEDFTVPPPNEYPMQDGRATGDPNAPVRIDVFEDFQCVACVRYSADIEGQIVVNYVATGQVYYVYRNYPFLDDGSVIKESDQAANAAMCAAEQGNFWDYHDLLYANFQGVNTGAYNERRLAAFAESLELDMDSFSSCYQENRFKSEIDTDLAEGRQLGVTGTPSLFVNGKVVSPGFVPTFEAVSEAVEAELAGGN